MTSHLPAVCAAPQTHLPLWLPYYLCQTAWVCLPPALEAVAAKVCRCSPNAGFHHGACLVVPTVARGPNHPLVWHQLQLQTLPSPPSAMPQLLRAPCASAVWWLASLGLEKHEMKCELFCSSFKSFTLCYSPNCASSILPTSLSSMPGIPASLPGLPISSWVYVIEKRQENEIFVQPKYLCICSLRLFLLPLRSGPSFRPAATVWRSAVSSSFLLMDWSRSASTCRPPVSTLRFSNKLCNEEVFCFM